MCKSWPLCCTSPLKPVRHHFILFFFLVVTRSLATSVHDKPFLRHHSPLSAYFLFRSFRQVSISIWRTRPTPAMFMHVDGTMRIIYLELFLEALESKSVFTAAKESHQRTSSYLLWGSSGRLCLDPPWRDIIVQHDFTQFLSGIRPVGRVKGMNDSGFSLSACPVQRKEFPSHQSPLCWRPQTPVPRGNAQDLALPQYPGSDS